MSTPSVAVYLLVLSNIVTFVNTRVTISNNGYNDLLVALPVKVSKEDQIQLINALKDLFDYSSRVLYVATKRRATFRQVTFLIPRSWNTQVFSSQIEGEISKDHGGFNVMNNADIVVSDDYQSIYPRVLHFDSCGKQGIRIDLPVEFLLTDQTLEQKSIEFIHYWSQYRYGVFPEGGFPSDERYPLYYSIPGSKEVHVTSCTNMELSYEITNTYGGSCIPETDFHSGKPANEECFYKPITTDETLRSSLMYQQSVPNVSEFCESDFSLEKSHNPNGPSKHNTLCSEEGTWFVILNHPDFAHGRNQATKYKPDSIEFKYVQESNLRVVVAIETSPTMKYKERFSLIKNAVTKFVLYDLPLESEFSLVFFNEDVKLFTDEMISFSTESDKIAFMESAPFEDEPDENGTASPILAINESLELLQEKEENGTGLIILITTEMHLNISQAQDLKEKLNHLDVRLLIILFSDEDSFKSDETSVTSLGTAFHIPENVEDKTESLRFLYSVFASILSGIYIEEKQSVTLFSKNLRFFDDEVSLNFNLDKSLDSDLTVLISGYGFDPEKPLLESASTALLNSHGESVATLQKQPFIPAWIFQTNAVQNGKYNFITRKRPGVSSSVFIFVTSKKKSTITTRAWTNAEDQTVNSHSALKIFAEVKYGIYPVIDAKVVAYIYYANLMSVSTIELLDTGLGDPDITKNDGIYSRYFANYTAPGYYSISVHVNSNENKSKISYGTPEYCCGSFVPSSKEEPTGSFSRIVEPISFLLTGEVSPEDIFPPSRILDLKVTNVDLDQMLYTLQWSSSGNDYDHGAASDYEIKLFSDRTEIRQRFEQSGHSLSDHPKIVNSTFPGEYGELQEYKIQLPRIIESGNYFLAVRATDDEYNPGEVSNAVEIVVVNPTKNNSIKCDLISDGNDPGAANTFKNSNIMIFIVALLFVLFFM